MVNLFCGRELLWLFNIIVLNTLLIVLSQKPSISIIYNSESEHDGYLQQSLFRGAFLGLMDADLELTFQPIFLDLSFENLTESLNLIKTEKCTTIISLLSSDELTVFVTKFLNYSKMYAGENNLIKIFTPRNINNLKLKSILKQNKQLLVFTLEMKEEMRIAALLHRISKVRTNILIPVLDDESQLPLLKLYEDVAFKLYPESQIKFQKPIFMSHSTSVTNAHLLSLLSHLSPPSHDTNNTTILEGVLLLSTKWLPEPLHGFWSEDHFFRWYSHTPIHERKKGTEILFGMYTIQYVGSTNWDTALRRNVIRDISNFSDPTPTVLSTILAFDAATIATKYAKHDGGVPLTLSGLSGDINFDDDGFRVGDTICLGISALSSIQSSNAMLLQNSTWILDDLVHLRFNESTDLFQVVVYQVGTSSLLTRTSLLNIATKSKEEGHGSCVQMSIEVTAHDPFTQLPYRYFFSQNTLPSTLLVPNQFGYGLKFLCETTDAVEHRMEIACTPQGIAIGATVYCFQSKLRLRERRSSGSYANSRVYYPIYSNSRDDMVNSFSSSYSLQPLAEMSTYKGEASMDTTPSLSSKATTEETTTMEPQTSPAPTPKLPDLRGILKNAKPFIGGCIGATTGCSVCVVVLGRLPLGALPAACTGPCFVTTFANCGALLGRTFAETTVICTELFKQGYLDLETFLVDAEFGNHLANEAPLTLKGYQKLASPLVRRMKTSEMMTRFVDLFASPWADYMMYLMGRTTKLNWIGYFVHNFGIILCETYGRLSGIWEENPATLFFHIITLVVLGVPFLQIIFFKWNRST